MDSCHLQIDADPDQAYHFDADPDPTFQLKTDPCGSGSPTMLFNYYVTLASEGAEDQMSLESWKVLWLDMDTSPGMLL